LKPCIIGSFEQIRPGNPENCFLNTVPFATLKEILRFAGLYLYKLKNVSS